MAISPGVSRDFFLEFPRNSSRSNPEIFTGIRPKVPHELEFSRILRNSTGFARHSISRSSSRSYLKILPRDPWKFIQELFGNSFWSFPGIFPEATPKFFQKLISPGIPVKFLQKFPGIPPAVPLEFLMEFPGDSSKKFPEITPGVPQ